jgi:predicted acylesterase/phospholipase RssA
MLGVVRAVFRRVRASARAPARARGADLSICVLPARRGVDHDGVVTDLVEALAKHGRTARLDPKRIDALLGKPGIAVSRSSEPGHIRLVQFLHEIEDEHRFVVYQAEPTWTEWTGRAIRQADYVLTVGVAGADPSPSQTERHIETYRKTQHPRWGLVLLQPADTTRPEGTRPWLDAREGVEEVFHLRRHHRPDLERLVRILSGRAVGVVFGGGGARGFAHLGVLRALEELGIPVDVVGGTSMGAPMAACAARGMTAAEALDEAREGYRSLLDYTLPFVSVISGAGITGSITRSLGAWNIEDLWLPYFCVSTNITRAAPVVHRRGSLHRAVRASVAIPGVLPPVPENGELLVDGGVLNNLPIDVMRELNPTGPVIAVDVVPNRGPAAPSDYGLAVSGWQVALGRLLPSRRMDVPGIGATMLRSMLVGADNARRQQVAAGLCDLYLNVQMRGIGMLDFDAVEPVAQIGYEQGLEALRTWVDGGGLA